MQRTYSTQFERSLPKLQKINQFQGSKEKDHQSVSYYQALRELKDVDQQIVVFRNRIKMLSEKQKQTQNPVGEYYQKKQAKLLSMNQLYKERSFQELRKVKQKTESDVALKKIKNQYRKRQHLRRIDRAKRIVTEQKFMRHDVMRERSEQNKNIIEKLRFQSLMEKQKKNQNMLQTSRKSRINLKEFQQTKLQQIRREGRKETHSLLYKIRQKQNELNQIKSQCQQREYRLKLAITKREKKMKKMQYSHKPFTIDTNSSYAFDKDNSTPRSAINYVVLS